SFCAARAYWRTPALFIPWIAVGGFAGAAALLTTIGRAGFGADHGLVDRYVTLALLMPVSLVPLGILAVQGGSSEPHAVRRLVGAAGAAGLTLAVLVTDARSLRGMADFRDRMKAGRECALKIDTASDECLHFLHPNADVVRLRAPQ